MRINRFLAQCGQGSRRAVEQLILNGVVSVNGEIVRDLARQVDEDQDRVIVNGHTVHPAKKFQYLMLNKPRGYDVTRGEHHHRRAYDLLPDGTHPAVQSVGRLDRDSTGLLLFMNDGDLAYRLTHPKHGCSKKYQVDVQGNVEREILDILLEGVHLDDGPAQALSVDLLPPPDKDVSRLIIEMAEGRKHIVRRMCDAVEHPVINLHRIQLGPLGLGDLRMGKTRPLTAREIASLKRSVGLRDEPKADKTPTNYGKPQPRRKNRR